MILRCAGCRKKMDVPAKEFELASEFAAKFETIARFYCLKCHPQKRLRLNATAPMDETSEVQEAASDKADESAIEGWTVIPPFTCFVIADETEEKACRHSVERATSAKRVPNQKS